MIDAEEPSKKQAPSRMGILGRYIITPRIFEILEHTKPGAGGEIQLTVGKGSSRPKLEDEGDSPEIPEIGKVWRINVPCDAIYKKLNN